MAKYGHVREGGKVGRSDATPTNFFSVDSNNLKSMSFKFGNDIFITFEMPGVAYSPPVYLHSIFEISSVTRIFFNFKISSLKNWKINLISKLIFAGYTGSRNQVQTRKKIKLVLNSIFFQVWNKLRNPKFENRVQRDRASALAPVKAALLCCLCLEIDGCVALNV